MKELEGQLVSMEVVRGQVDQLIKLIRIHVHYIPKIPEDSHMPQKSCY